VTSFCHFLSERFSYIIFAMSNRESNRTFIWMHRFNRDSWTVSCPGVVLIRDLHRGCPNLERDDSH
jgi:hypothetical protein